MLFPMVGGFDPALLTQMVATAMIVIACLTCGPTRPPV
jgi:hypothetical protein